MAHDKSLKGPLTHSGPLPRVGTNSTTSSQSSRYKIDKDNFIGYDTINGKLMKLKEKEIEERTNGKPVLLDQGRSVKCPLIVKDKDTPAGMYIATINLGQLGHTVKWKRRLGSLKTCGVYIVQPQPLQLCK